MTSWWHLLVSITVGGLCRWGCQWGDGRDSRLSLNPSAPWSLPPLLLLPNSQWCLPWPRVAGDGGWGKRGVSYLPSVTGNVFLHCICSWWDATFLWGLGRLPDCLASLPLVPLTRMKLLPPMPGCSRCSPAKTISLLGLSQIPWRIFQLDFGFVQIVALPLGHAAPTTECSDLWLRSWEPTSFQAFMGLPGAYSWHCTITPTPWNPFPGLNKDNQMPLPLSFGGGNWH